MESGCYSVLTSRQKLNKLKAQLSFSPSEKWGHRANHCPKSGYRWAQRITTYWGRNPLGNQCLGVKTDIVKDRLLGAQCGQVWRLKTAWVGEPQQALTGKTGGNAPSCSCQGGESSHHETCQSTGPSSREMSLPETDLLTMSLKACLQWFLSPGISCLSPSRKKHKAHYQTKKQFEDRTASEPDKAVMLELSNQEFKTAMIIC